MAVQIPQLKRLDAPAPESVGRIEVNAPDSGAQQLGAVVGAFSEGLVAVDKYIENEDKNTANTEALRAGIEYEQWADRKLEGDSANGIAGLRHIKGDPTEAYNTFDREAAEKLKEIQERYKDSSDRVKGAVADNLVTRHNGVYGKRLIAYGQQYSTYQQSVSDAAVNMEIKNASESLQLVKAGKPATLAPFESNLSNINRLIIRQGFNNGMSQPANEGDEGAIPYVDDNHQIAFAKINPSVADEIKEKVSKATYLSINSLLSSKKPESAKMMMDRYKSFLDPVSRAKLDEDFDKVDIETKAYGILAKLDDKPLSEQEDALNAIPTSGPHGAKIVEKAFELLDANNRHRENRRKRINDSAFNDLSIYVQDKMKSEDPFDTVQQLESDEYFNKNIGKITEEKDYKALYALVEKRKNSDKKAYLDALDAATNGSFTEMNAADFNRLMTGLSDSDKKLFTSAYVRLSTESSSQERSKVKNMLDTYTELVNSSGALDRDNRDNILPDDRERSSRYKAELLTKLKNLPKDMTTAELAQYAKDAAAVTVFNIKKEKETFAMKQIRKTSIGKRLFPEPPPPEEPVSLRGIGEPRNRRGGGTPIPKTATPTTTPPAAQSAPVPEPSKVPTDTDSFKKMSGSEKLAIMKAFIEANKRKPTSNEEMLNWLANRKQ